MSKLENEVFTLYQEGNKIEQISTKLGINREVVRQIILRKAKSQ